MNSKITVITPTGDRPLAFALCQKWMAAQTRQPDQWLIIDDGKTMTSVDIQGGWHYVRREPKKNDPKFTLALNLKKALPLVTGDKIIIFEDDDYYAPTYIETMARMLETHVVAGIINAKYYHLPTGGFYQNHNDRHASFAQTAFRKEILPAIREILDACQTPFIDIQIWETFRSQGKLFSDEHNIFTSMKGLPGRAGIGGGHKETIYRNHDTADREMLKRWIPKDYQVYIDLFNKTAFPKVPCDIIIPTYENEDFTVACFESIKRCTKPGTYRIIWVDNGSKNFMRAEKVLEGIDHIIVRLPKNLGFVGAVNKGISISNSDFVCLLNNDTIVSTGWLEKLIGAFALDLKLGIVGALTSPPPAHLPKNYDSHHNIRFIEDHAGRRIFPPFSELENFNRQIEVNFDKVLADCAFVAFLCAVIRRGVIDRIGLLDENYAMGMYDDNDYNLAARKAGYETKLLYSTCIHHWGRSTFNMVQKTENLDVKGLLNRNRRYLMEKWGLRHA